MGENTLQMTAQSPTSLPPTSIWHPQHSSLISTLATEICATPRNTPTSTQAEHRALIAILPYLVAQFPSTTVDKSRSAKFASARLKAARAVLAALNFSLHRCVTKEGVEKGALAGKDGDVEIRIVLLVAFVGVCRQLGG